MNEEVAALAARPGVAPWRVRLASIVESPTVTNVIIAVILANAAIMGLETHRPLMESHGDLVHLLDKICLAIFVVELVAKLAAYQTTFFASGWRIFDFLVVAVALAPGAGPWAVLRSLRVLRVLRLLTIVPSLRRVVAAFLHAIPGLLGVVAVMSIIFYTAGVLATTLYSESFPEFFGDLSTSLYSLFQVMTLDSWHSQIVRPMVAADPSAGPFFLIFVVVTSFTVLNLFIGIIVTAMQEISDAEAADKVAKQERADEEARVAEVALLGVEGSRAAAAEREREAREAASSADHEASIEQDAAGLATNGTPTNGALTTATRTEDVAAIIERMERDLAALRVAHSSHG